MDASQEPSGDSVLVVDDNSAVRRVCAKILTGAGFRVECAEGGEDALALVERGDFRVDLAVLDLTMPGLDGRGTLSALRRLCPRLPAVLISGVDGSHLASGAEDDTATRFLGKPFLPDDLIAAVRSGLAARPDHS
ncbi:MAG: response regulator [Planctomycetota bacterium]